MLCITYKEVVQHFKKTGNQCQFSLLTVNPDKRKK